MNLTKQECDEALYELSLITASNEQEECDGCSCESCGLNKNSECKGNSYLWYFQQLINERFENDPLRLEEIKPTMCVYIKDLNINGVVLNVDKREIKVLYVALANKETNYYDRFHEWFEFDEHEFYKLDM